MPLGKDILTETLRDKRYCQAITHKLIGGNKGLEIFDCLINVVIVDTF